MWKNENTDSGILRGSFIYGTWQLNSRAKENLFPLELVLSCAGEECVKMLFPGPQPTYATVPSLPESENFSSDDGFCDFAFGSTQNDRLRGVLGRVNVFIFE